MSKRGLDRNEVMMEEVKEVKLSPSSVRTEAAEDSFYLVDVKVSLEATQASMTTRGLTMETQPTKWIVDHAPLLAEEELKKMQRLHAMPMRAAATHAMELRPHGGARPAAQVDMAVWTSLEDLLTEVGTDVIGGQLEISSAVPILVMACHFAIFSLVTTLGTPPPVGTSPSLYRCRYTSARRRTTWALHSACTCIVSRAATACLSTR